jgi:hypothetical protein
LGFGVDAELMRAQILALDAQPRTHTARKRYLAINGMT